MTVPVQAMNAANAGPEARLEVISLIHDFILEERYSCSAEKMTAYMNIEIFLADIFGVVVFVDGRSEVLIIPVARPLQIQIFPDAPSNLATCHLTPAKCI